MVTLQEVIKELCKMGLGIQVQYCADTDSLEYDLNTGAKSELRLYEDFTVKGRYSYENKIDCNQELTDILCDLFWEFRNCLHGREYCNNDWNEIGVKLGCIKKTVVNHTTTLYS